VTTIGHVLARVRRGGARRIRYGAWKASYLTRDAGRRATGRLRTMPTFLIGGEMKCGSSSLFEYLLRHPAILGSAVKEVHYFDFHYHRGPGWYRSHFPMRFREAAAIGEATPYLFHPLAPRRVFETDPSLRLVVVLRDPVERTHSHYWDEVSFRKEPLSFEEALEAEPERLRGEAERMLAEPGYVSDAHYRFSYVARGRYREALDRWLELFPREQLFVVGLEELIADLGRFVPELCRFIGVPVRDLSSFPAVNRKAYPPLEPATRERLAALFEEPNRELYELVGRDLGWSRAASHVRSG
jgi:hypothetical protein